MGGIMRRAEIVISPPLPSKRRGAKGVWEEKPMILKNPAFVGFLF